MNNAERVKDPRPRVVMVDGVPMSGLVAAVPTPKAVVVAIHGGATSSTYFDCPGHPWLSLLRTAAAHGYTAIALDRPGYGASALYQSDLADADRRVALSYGAVDKMLGSDAFGAGVFLFAHSAGCELAVRMAVAPRDAESGVPIGIELAGTGLRYHDSAKDVIKQATVNARPAGLRDLLWQPTELYPDEVLTGALSAPGVAYEAKVTANWARRDFPELAARVTVPVEFSIGEHERVWETSPEAVSAISALFTSAPSVKINDMPGSGHNLSVGLTAQIYHERVLSFVDVCVTAREGVRIEAEAM